MCTVICEQYLTVLYVKAKELCHAVFYEKREAGGALKDK